MITRYGGVLLVLLGLLCVTALRAQDPSLTELERTKAELLDVRTAYAQLLAQYDACKAEVGQTYQALGRLRADAASAELSTEEARLTAQIEAGHPGYSWNPKTRTFTKKAAEKVPEKRP